MGSLIFYQLVKSGALFLERQNTVSVWVDEDYGKDQLISKR